MKKLIILIIVLLFRGYSQELDATVIVNYEKLPINNKENLSQFQATIEDYLNKTKFTNQPGDYPKIKCTFNIFFNSASDEVTYSVQVVVNSLREIYGVKSYSPMLLVNDANWNFSYERNQPLYPDPNIFHPIASFLDFYALLIIGLEYDSWEKMSGTPFFQSAFEIAKIAQVSRFKKGWESGSSSYNRIDLVQDILSEKYRSLREGAYEYQYGIDLYQKKPKEGQAKIAEFVRTLEAMKSKIDIRSVYVRMFFESKSGEIIDYVKNIPEKSELFKVLKSVDPARISKYDEALK